MRIAYYGYFRSAFQDRRASCMLAPAATGIKATMSETTYDAAETTPDRTTLCPFCQLPVARIVAEDELAVVIRDAFPVSAGHTIIVPRRHVRSFFEATDTERASLLRLLDEAKVTLDAEHQPTQGDRAWLEAKAMQSVRQAEGRASEGAGWVADQAGRALDIFSPSDSPTTRK